MTTDLMLDATSTIYKRMLTRSAAEARVHSNRAKFKSEGGMAGMFHCLLPRCNVQVFFLTYLFAFTATYRNVPTGTACVRLSSNSAGSDAVPTFVQDYETVFKGNVPDGVESGDHFKVQLGDDGDVLVKCPDGKPARVCGGSSHVHVSLTVYFSILFPLPNIL